MKKLLVGVLVSVLLLVGVIGLAAGQDGGLAGLLQPLVVDVEQAVPVEVLLAVPVGEGEVMTVTAPITVHVGLRVSIDGPQVVTVEPLPAEEASITVEAVELESEETSGGSPRDVYLSAELKEAAQSETGGVTIVLEQLDLMDWQAMQTSTVPDVSDIVKILIYEHGGMAERLLLGVMEISIENNSDQLLTVEPFWDGLLLLGSEQISLSDYQSLAEDVGELLPGAAINATAFFGTERISKTDVVDVIDAKLIFDPPFDDSYMDVSDEHFEFDVRLE